MYEFIIQILQAELFARSSYISFFIPVSFQDSVYSRYQDVASDIEFTLAVEERILEVLLDY